MSDEFREPTKGGNLNVHAHLHHHAMLTPSTPPSTPFNTPFTPLQSLPETPSPTPFHHLLTALSLRILFTPSSVLLNIAKNVAVYLILLLHSLRHPGGLPAIIAFFASKTAKFPKTPANSPRFSPPIPPSPGRKPLKWRSTPHPPPPRPVPLHPQPRYDARLAVSKEDHTTQG